MTEVGYGLDGCVYNPGFCKTTHKHPERNYISKVMRQGREKAELEAMRYDNLNLSALDPEMNYFISDPELCALSQMDSFKFEMARKEQQCKEIIKPYYAVNYVDGGQDLFVIISSIYDLYELGDFLPLTKWNEYLHAFKNIFEGIKILNENGIYHLDVKPDNIVFDTSSNPPKFKLIDFGLSHTKANPPTKTVGSFKFIPPEMYMLPNKNLGLMDTKSQYNYFFYTVNASDKIYLLKKPSVSYYESLTFEQKYEKADIWALGMTLIELYNTMVECPNYTDEELIVYGDIGQLAYSMIDPFVETRITTEDALIEYNRILSNIDVHFAMQNQAQQQAQQNQQVTPIQSRKRNYNTSNGEPSAKKSKTNNLKYSSSISGGKRKKITRKKRFLKKYKKTKRSYKKIRI